MEVVPSKMAAFRSHIVKFFKQGLLTTTGLAVFGTGCYITYQDYRRYPRMVETFERGNILSPLKINSYETKYFDRPDIERRVREIMSPSFSNEYYIIKGELGSGKTRTVLQLVRELIKSDGSENAGAPVYVLAAQGTSFPENLAEAVNFNFDEHLNFKYFLDYMLKIRSGGSTDSTHKLSRVLDAIEIAAYRYTQEHGRPVVLVIDGVNYVTKHCPEAIEKLSDKAKLWSDTNIAKLVLITNDEHTERILRENQSSWLRTDAPIYIGDLCEAQATEILSCSCGMNPTEKTKQHNKERISSEQAKQIYDAVGGRVQHLLIVKRDFHDNVPFETTLGRLRQKEKEKFLTAAKSACAVRSICELYKMPNKTMPIQKFLKMCGLDHMEMLCNLNLIKYIEGPNEEVMVCFESKITESVVKSIVSDL